MGKQWIKQHKHDHYYKKAKQMGYRSRAAFKLLQIHRKFHIIEKEDVVVDLGAAPGGWTQVALELVGQRGMVIGIDLVNIRPIEGAIFVKGDVTEEESIKHILSLIKNCGKERADVILSDMAPNISGNYSTDHARSVFLAEKALDAALNLLRPGGNFVVKVFEGDMFKGYLKKLKERFEYVKAFSPPASRSASSEIYIVCRHLKDDMSVTW